MEVQKEFNQIRGLIGLIWGRKYFFFYFNFVYVLYLFACFFTIQWRGEGEKSSVCKQYKIGVRACVRALCCVCVTQKQRLSWEWLAHMSQLAEFWNNNGLERGYGSSITLAHYQFLCVVSMMRFPHHIHIRVVVSYMSSRASLFQTHCKSISQFPLSSQFDFFI